MTFLTELERLTEAIAAETNGFRRFALGQQRDALLANHSRAIADLVRAAEKMKRHSGSCQRALEQCGMNAALAALN